MVINGNTFVDMGPHIVEGHENEDWPTNDYNYILNKDKRNAIYFSKIIHSAHTNIAFSPYKDQIFKVTVQISSYFFRPTDSLSIGFQFLLADNIEQQSAGI